MPDKHEVGGSSPLGPTTESKTLQKNKIRRKRPRAFLERALSKRGVILQGERDAESLRSIKAPARDKHRHKAFDFHPV